MRRAAPPDGAGRQVAHSATSCRPGRQARHPPDGSDVRLTPTEWHLLEVLVRHPGRLLSQRQLLPRCGVPAYGAETSYLRVYMAQLRRKLEPDPARPRQLHHRAGHGLPVPAGRCTPGRPGECQQRRELGITGAATMASATATPTTTAASVVTLLREARMLQA